MPCPPVDLDANGEVYLSFIFHDGGLNRDHDARVFLGRAAARRLAIGRANL